LQKENFPILQCVVFVIRKKKSYNIFYLVSLLDKFGLLFFNGWYFYL
jgi:hypothetical protein